MRVLFHAGMPKTGTSALQNALAAFQDELVDYPSLFRGEQIAHHALARALLQQGEAERNKALSDLELYLSNSARKRLVIFSSESLMGLVSESGLPISERLCCFENRTYSSELHFIVREIAGFFEAMYLQSSRFGRIKMSFPDYLATRRDWTVSLFQALKVLRAKLGPKLKVALQEENFDTLAYFERVLELERDQLFEISKKQRPSSRFGLRGECILTHLETFNAEFGTDFERAKVVRNLETRRLFSEDIHAYTLYDQKLWAKTTSLALTAAKETGFHDYLENFEYRRCRDAPEVSLDYKTLTHSDKEEALSVLRKSII